MNREDSRSDVLDHTMDIERRSIAVIDYEVRVLFRDLRSSNRKAFEPCGFDQLTRFVPRGIDKDRTATWHIQWLFRKSNVVGLLDAR